MVPVANTLLPSNLVRQRPTFRGRSVSCCRRRSPRVVDVRMKSQHGEGTDGGVIWAV